MPDFARTTYEALLAMLRTQLERGVRERISAELKSRDRAMHNQWVEVCGGGEFR